MRKKHFVFNHHTMSSQNYTQNVWKTLPNFQSKNSVDARFHLWQVTNNTSKCKHMVESWRDQVFIFSHLNPRNVSDWSSPHTNLTVISVTSLCLSNREKKFQRMLKPHGHHDVCHDELAKLPSHSAASTDQHLHLGQMCQLKYMSC